MIEEKKTPLYLSSIPSEWAIVPLERVLSMCQYGISDGLIQEGKYPVLRMNNIESGSILPKDIKYVDIPEEYFIRFKLAKGDILFNRTNSHELVGQTGIFREDGDYTFASYLIRLRCNPDYARSEYLNYYLNYEPILKEIRRLATRGVSQSNINASNLKKVIIALPPLEVQNIIEDILQHVDANLELSNETDIRYEVLKKGLMQRLLTQGIGHTRFKQTKIGEIPESWEVKTIGQMTKINAESLKNGTHPESEIEYIEIASIENPGYIQHTSRMIFSEAPSRARRIVKKGDVIVSTVRPYLKAFALIRQQSDNLIASTGFAVLTPSKNLDSEFLLHSVLSERFMKHLSRRMVGSNYPAVSAKDIEQYHFPCPPLEEQRAIANILHTVDKNMENGRESSIELDHLKKGLMQVLLTGKVRVTI